MLQLPSNCRPRVCASGIDHALWCSKCAPGPGLIRLEETLAACQAAGCTTSVCAQFDASGRWGGIPELCPRLDLVMPPPDSVRPPTTVGALCHSLYVAATLAGFCERGRGGCDVWHCSARRGWGRAGSALVQWPGGEARRHYARVRCTTTTILSRTVDPQGIEHILNALGGRRKEGALAAEKGGGMWRQPAVQLGPGELKDTTGAGDAFTAGFMMSWLASGSVPDALRWGCACGVGAHSSAQGRSSTGSAWPFC